MNEFDEIRPYEAGEMKQAFETLINDRQFNVVMKGFAPWLPKGVRNALLRLAFTGVKTPLDFQRRFMKPVVKYIIRKHTDGCRFDDAALQGNHISHLSSPISHFDERYTFVSNHRDIVLDSAFLDVKLFEGRYPTTVEIGIGDNLLIYPWIKTLVRMNKAFTVRRGLSLRETLAASQLMSRYIHYAVTQKRENIWIAQREGRAKDSDDRTQDAVLKMLAMGGCASGGGSASGGFAAGSSDTGGKTAGHTDSDASAAGGKTAGHSDSGGGGGEKTAGGGGGGGSAADSLRELNIVPLTISYEYDPCDYLKAQEFQQKRDNPAFKKSKQDDLDNMKTGIFGYKGRVVYRAAAPINTWLDELKDLPSKEFFAAVAKRMDHEIHRGYELFACNYIAADLLSGDDSYADHYTAADKERFENYLQGQLAKIQLPAKDEPFLRERMLTMYANPLKNYLAAL